MYCKRFNFCTMNSYFFCILDHALTLWSFFYLYISLNLDEYNVPSSLCSSIDFFMHPSIINVVSFAFYFVLCPTLSMCLFHLIPFFILPLLMCLLHLYSIFYPTSISVCSTFDSIICPTYVYVSCPFNCQLITTG